MNILLVEDDRDNRIQMGKFLRELGHRVVECDNGHDAIKLLNDSFHMVMSDIKMPRMSGIELLRKLKSSPYGRDVDVVLFTGHGDMESAIDSLRAGAYDYLLKPVNVRELALITDRSAEQQALRRENRILTEKFEVKVREATAETEKELSRIKKAYAQSVGLGKIGVFSGVMENIFTQAHIFHADRSIPVLIQGETGTGKEVVARQIHFENLRETAPFVDVNCAALHPGIFESELFGYEAGAFTGGLPGGQKGKLDIATGGTIFLDEITELPIELQAKLLRVIQEKEFYRVGGLRKIKTDVRIICATNLDIQERVEQGTFRKDLYYRLNVGHITIPPLRNRTEDILPLAGMFLEEFARRRGKRFRSISRQASEIMRSYNWPGNVRELRNAMEWVVLMHDDFELKPLHLGILQQSKIKTSFAENNVPPVLDSVNFTLPAQGLDIEGFYNKILYRTLEMCGGNKTRAARYLGISRRSLQCRLNRAEKSNSAFHRPD